MQAKKCIHIEHAKQHNLRDLSLDIPRDELVVVCGPSGSGKSTLAFDVVYAEGQRRYVESLSAYARQFLPQLDKPDVGKIEGLTPAISLEQGSSSNNPRSTVGTVTEIHDFLRVFFSRLGTSFCPSCGRPVEARSSDEIVEEILALPERTRFMLLAPLVERQKGTQQDLFRKVQAEGFSRLRVDGAFCSVEELPELDKNRKHDVDLVVDRLVVKEGMRTRLSESVELCLSRGEGRLRLFFPDAKEGERERLFSSSFACPVCHISLSKPEPKLFTFNVPSGACPRCVGLGTVDAFEPRLIAPNRGLSIGGGALLPWSTPARIRRYLPALKALGGRFGFGLETPLLDFSEDALAALFYGEDEQGRPAHSSAGLRRNWMGGNVAVFAKGDYQSEHFAHTFAVEVNLEVTETRWPGVIPLLEKGMQYGEAFRDELVRYRETRPCPACGGRRLSKEALAVKVAGKSLADLSELSVAKAIDWLKGLDFSGSRWEAVADALLKELLHRLSFLSMVGLDYLTLSRSMVTLSGGEAQRIRLASQLGAGLAGVTYVLDEPSIGLHPRDNARLLGTLRSLQQRGNTVIVVEHDESTIRAADTVIELGPGSGEQGGGIEFMGSPAELLKASTLTARCLRGELPCPRPTKRREAKGELLLRGVTTHNLKNIDVRIPLGVLVCVTGVSGSGKSSLVMDTLAKHVAIGLGQRVEAPGTLSGLEGRQLVERLVEIDQSPIGRTPRSNPATYTKLFDEIRKLFAQTPEARRRGFEAGRFSFNVSGGRCETCQGDGQIRVEMHFLPDIYVTCDVCHGRRYNHETLAVRWKGLNIAEVLDLTVHQAREFFSSFPAIERRLGILEDVGLGYIRLGQSATTLSGGEAQRIKITRELGKKNLPGSLYILDEPTTGLHMHEVAKLLKVLHALVDKGASVVLIEHNADCVMAADHVIDMGPGGGETGGEVVFEGTPERMLEDPSSLTGLWLAKEARTPL